MNKVLSCLAILMLTACTTPTSDIHKPLTARPAQKMPPTQNNGSIFQAGSNDRNLFEDVRAHNVGDVLTINLVESTSASQKNANDASHSSSAKSSIQGLGMPGMPLVNASSANKLANASDSSGSNVLSGVITVTVIEVLPNGNLAVSGEKMVSINQVREFIRFYGVVNPRTITAANTVPSTQVADARIEYKGADSNVDGASILSSLSRFFQTISPF